MLRDEPIYVYLPTKYYTVTVYGAIGSVLKSHFYFKLGQSTNQDEFRAFVRELKTQVTPDYPRRGRGNISPVVVLDNASAHKTHLSTRCLEALFSPYF